MIKIFYDTETTGTNPKIHSIHQLSGLIEVDGDIVDSFDYSVRPHPRASYDPAALSVCKVTRKQLEGYTDMKTVFKQFTKLLDGYVDKFNNKDKIYLIGFNNRAFDDAFLRMFFELCGSSFIGSYFFVDTIDTLCLASQYLMGDRRLQMPSFKLKRVALELGIVIDKSKLHDSMYDAELVRQIYRIVTGIEIEL